MSTFAFVRCSILVTLNDLREPLGGEVKIKRVSVVDGNRIKRPSDRQRNQEHWHALQVQRRAMQTVDGKVYCGTCNEVEGGQFGMQLHHRHYDRFGDERIEDVILLCGPCHDAITSRIRSKRYAAGDLSIEYEIRESNSSRYLPKPRQINVTPEQKDEPARPSFRPMSRYTHG